MEYRVSYGIIQVLQADITEVIVDNGVELTLEMHQEEGAFCRAHLSPHFGLLINRSNQYSYSFAAQQAIAGCRDAAAIAVVVYDDSGRRTVQLIRTFVGDNAPNIALFCGRDEALSWLQAEMKRLQPHG